MSGAPPAEPAASVREDFREIVRDFAGSRDLLVELTRRDLRIRYKQSVVGVLWALITPLMVIGSGWLVRLVLATMAGGAIDGAAFAGIAVKSVGWAFFVGALGFGTSSLTQNLALVTKVYFPRELLPISAILTQLVDSAIGAVALLVLLPIIGITPGWTWLWAPALVLVLVALTAALTLLLSCVNVFFRDARHAVQLILSFGIFVTPVFFDASAFGPTGARLVMLNPLAPVLEGLRLALVEGHNLAAPIIDATGVTGWNPWWLVYATSVAATGLAASALIFHRAEFKFAEYV